MAAASEAKPEMQMKATEHRGAAYAPFLVWLLIISMAGVIFAMFRFDIRVRCFSTTRWNRCLNHDCSNYSC